ncbi:vitamin B12 transporter [Thermoflavifilum aggregans]|uniref:Vitamin B12 transporter n=1 Tax=Thermoflavifilum aggregans TaxID=454188 RepID=A0A2M9CX82_9BACT|nr:TonB-dependent receptor [Thermoflavifilum aggregans]PJJ76497.1 vitamin B12 transporter [Thermoflavifilum aggregans]
MSKLLCYFTVFGSLISFTAIAQTEKQDTAISRHGQLQEVVVTATKFPKPVNQTGNSVIVITHEQLLHSQGETLSQILDEQTGITINGANSNYGKDKAIYIRGAGSDYTVILLDGMPLYDPSGMGGAFDLRLIPIDEVERIEIVKGGLSTLYGTDAIAGVINIITRQAAQKPVEGNADVSYGSYQTFQAHAALNGKLRVFTYDVQYDHMQSGGISEATDSTGKAGFDKDGMNSNAVLARLGWDIQPNWKLQPFFRYDYFFGNTDAGSFTDSKDHYQASDLNTGFQTTYQLSSGAIHAHYLFEQTHRTYHSESYGDSRYEGRHHDAEIYWNQNFGKHLQLLAGSDYRYLKMPDTTAKKKNPSVYFISPYAALFWANEKGFNAELGGRFTHHEQYGNNFSFTFNPSFIFSSGITLSADISSSFKAPTLTMLYGPYSPNPDLKPEIGYQYEAGITVPYGNGKSNMQFTVFRRKIKNIIVYTPAAYINQNEQRDWGIEYQQTIQATSKLSFTGSFVYLDGQLTTLQNGKDTTYENLLRKPKASFKLSAQWQVLPALFVGSSLENIGDRTDLDFNTYPFAPVTLKAYTLWNAFVSYTFRKQYMLYLQLRNITNTSYTEVYGYNTMGFHIIGGIRARF